MKNNTNGTKETKAQVLHKKVDALSEATGGAIQQTHKMIDNVAFGLNILFEETFKDAPIHYEEQVNKDDYPKYIPIVGKFFKVDNQVIKLERIERNWTVDTTNKVKTSVPKMQGSTEMVEVDAVEVNFKYDGISPDVDYPTTFTATCFNPTESVMKLREFLFSLKKEIIV